MGTRPTQQMDTKKRDGRTHTHLRTQTSTCNPTSYPTSSVKRLYLEEVEDIEVETLCTFWTPIVPWSQE